MFSSKSLGGSTARANGTQKALDRRRADTVERSLIRERQREGIALAQQRGAYKGRKKTLTPERAAELVQRAANGIPKSVLASDYGISRETVYQYLRQAKPD
jgi:DNA invertase Pin-like site-specific DNA recombinase